MSGTKICILCTRPTHLAGAVLAVGQVLALSPLEAAELLRNGKGELVKPADEPAVRAAVGAHVARLTAEPPLGLRPNRGGWVS